MKVIGVGTHAASPHDGVDPITTAAHIITATQTMLTRGLEAKQPKVLSITKFHAGNTHNVIPPFAELGGTLRTYNEELRSKTKQKFEKLARCTAEAHGAEQEDPA